MAQTFARSPLERPSPAAAGLTPSGAAPSFAESNQDRQLLLAQAAPSGASASPVLDAAGGASATRVAPLRSDPTPWAAQQRAVSFRDVPGGALFQGGPAPTDVVQGQNGARHLGDCWMLSSLAAVANTQPQLLTNAIRDHGDGTYTVTLHKQGKDGRVEAEEVRVTDNVPVTPDGRDAYAQRQDPRELWVVLMQKAFASRNGGYGGLDGGVPAEALTALTGRPSRTASALRDPSGTQDALRRGTSQGFPMVAASRADLSQSATGIVPGHGYTVLGTEGRDGQEHVVLRDPFAKYEPSGNGARDGVFRVPLSEFSTRFQYVTWSEPEVEGPRASGPAPSGPAPSGPAATPAR